MPDSFDPYYKWFGIPPKDQPPNHYRLLGLELYESDLDVIESAADRQMAHLRSLQSGPHGALSQKLLNEVSAARLCLLDPARREAYDDLLRSTAPSPATPIASRESCALPADARGFESGAPVPVTPAGSGAIQAAPVAVALPAESAEDSLPRRALWQEPVIVAAAAAGLLIGTVVVGALIWLPLGDPRADESIGDIFVAVRGTSAERINAASFAEAANDGPQGPGAVVNDATASAPRFVNSAANASENRPVVPDNDASQQQGTEIIRGGEPLPRPITREPAGTDAPLARLSAPPPSDDHGAAQPADAAVATDEPGELAAPDAPAELDYKTIGRPINLLAAVNLERDVVNGTWQSAGKDLVSPDHVLWARVMIPYSVPDEYILTVTVEVPDRQEGRHENLNLGLVAGGARQFMYCVTAFGNGGLFLLDGKEWHVNETSHRDHGILKPGENTIVCTVRSDAVEAKVNDGTFIDWKGDFSRLTLQPAWQCPLTSVLFLGTCCDYRFTKVELQRIRSLDRPRAGRSKSRKSSRARTRGQGATPP